MPDQSIPLPTAPAPCWRCGGPSSRQGLRSELCATCAARVAEIVRLYQGPQAPQTPADDDDSR
jgi:hypothetical protein